MIKMEKPWRNMTEKDIQKSRIRTVTNVLITTKVPELQKGAVITWN